MIQVSVSARDPPSSSFPASHKAAIRTQCLCFAFLAKAPDHCLHSAARGHRGCARWPTTRLRASVPHDGELQQSEADPACTGTGLYKTDRRTDRHMESVQRDAAAPCLVYFTGHMLSFTHQHASAAICITLSTFAMPPQLAPILFLHVPFFRWLRVFSLSVSGFGAVGMAQGGSTFFQLTRPKAFRLAPAGIPDPDRRRPEL